MAKHRLKLLEQLRADYQSKEAEIKASIVKIANEERRQKEAAVKAYKEIEFKLGQDIIKLAMEQAKEAIARSIYKQFARYMRKAGAYDDEGFYNFKIAKRYARIAMPDRLMQDALREYTEWSRPRLMIMDDPIKYVQTIQIKIPQLSINVVLNK